MQRPLGLLLALAAVFTAPALCQDFLADPTEEPQAPLSWWLSLSNKAGSWCGLRNFPPIPDGEGPVRILCNQGFDQEFIFNVRKVSAVGSGGWDLTSGDQIYLRSFNPLLSWCRVRGREPVFCGYVYEQASKFVIEKVDTSGGASIDITKDAVYLRGPSSGSNNYCSVANKGTSSFLTCATSKKSATKLTFPANSYGKVSLVSELTQNPCGGIFIGYDSSPNYVNCSRPVDPVNTNFPQAFSYTFEKPSTTTVFKADVGVTLKGYDTLWHYHMVNWLVGFNNTVQFGWNTPTTKRQWFTFKKTSSASAGSLLQSGDVIALYSNFAKKFCGIITPSQVSLRCDQDASTIVDSLASGYKFKFVIE